MLFDLFAKCWGHRSDAARSGATLAQLGRRLGAARAPPGALLGAEPGSEGRAPHLELRPFKRAPLGHRTCSFVSCPARSTCGPRHWACACCCVRAALPSVVSTCPPRTADASSTRVGLCVDQIATRTARTRPKFGAFTWLTPRGRKRRTMRRNAHARAPHAPTRAVSSCHLCAGGPGRYCANYFWCSAHPPVLHSNEICKVVKLGRRAPHEVVLPQHRQGGPHFAQDPEHPRPDGERNDNDYCRPHRRVEESTGPCGSRENRPRNTACP